MRPWITYLIQRFQIIPLSLLVFSDLWVVSRLTEGSWSEYLLLLLIVMTYLFHNRVADDERDYNFDAQFHQDRDVQKGVLSIKTMKVVSRWTAIVLLILCALNGWLGWFVGLVLVLIARWVRVDFGLPETFKSNYFFLYNFLNMLQMLVLQIAVYVLIIGSLEFSFAILIHIALVFALSMHAEWTRKILPEKTAGRDYYSDRLGFKPSLIFWFCFGPLVGVLAIFLGVEIGIELSYLLVAMAVLLSILLAGLMAYQSWKNKKGETLFWVSFLSVYVGINALLALA